MWGACGRGRGCVGGSDEDGLIISYVCVWWWGRTWRRWRGGRCRRRTRRHAAWSTRRGGGGPSRRGSDSSTPRRRMRRGPRLSGGGRPRTPRRARGAASGWVTMVGEEERAATCLELCMHPSSTTYPPRTRAPLQLPECLECVWGVLRLAPTHPSPCLPSTDCLAEPKSSIC